MENAVYSSAQLLMEFRQAIEGMADVQSRTSRDFNRRRTSRDADLGDLQIMLDQQALKNGIALLVHLNSTGTVSHEFSATGLGAAEKARELGRMHERMEARLAVPSDFFEGS